MALRTENLDDPMPDPRQVVLDVEAVVGCTAT